MALQITNDFDKKLNQLYSSKITVNLEAKSTMSVSEFWSSMELIAVNHKAMINYKAVRSK